MHRGILLLTAVMLGVFGFTYFASATGMGVPKPEREPISIREESARGKPLGSGHHRTRYFLIGGGLHGGK